MGILYVSALSPYGARLRLVVALTGLVVPMAPPPDGAGSAAMCAITPFGKVPALDTGSRVIVESAALMEYFAEQAPQAGLLPDDAVRRAAARGVIQAFDHYVIASLTPAFAQLRSNRPDRDLIRAGLSAAVGQLERLAGLLDDGAFAIGDRISIADCAIIPFAALMVRLGGTFDVVSAYTAQRRWAAWWQAVQSVPQVQQVLAQMAAAFANAFAPTAATQPA